MTEEFEVHGPHDHVLEHAAEGGDSFSGKIAVTTAILATVGALFSYEVGSTQNEAAMYKNDAAIRKTEAANQWNFYQAKNNKQNLAELALSLPVSDKDKYTQAIQRYAAEKADIKKEAEKLEAESKHWDETSEQTMHIHHRWALAMTLIQIAISISAITLLTRKQSLMYAVYGMSLGGFVFAGLAILHF